MHDVVLTPSDKKFGLILTVSKCVAGTRCMYSKEMFRETRTPMYSFFFYGYQWYRSPQVFATDR
jgi:hypothetical protein